MADSQLDEFCKITGASRERGEFFLKAAGGNLQAATDAYYSDDITEPIEESGGTPQVPESRDNSSTSKNVPQNKKSGLATLSDYHSSGSKPLKDDEDEGENYYAGGSEHSGQMISGPPRKKKDLAKEVFEAAKQHGAVPLEDLPKEKTTSSHFVGSGFRLGDSEGPSAMIPGPPVPSKPKKVLHTLRFWKDGFSVDDGPLRTGQDEADKEFLSSVSKGQIPMELIHAARGGEVDINLEDKRNENYVRPKPKVKAFSGEGYKLGNVTPQVHSSQPSSSSTASSSSNESPAGPVPVPVSVSVDSSQPVTSLQIRLADGTRLQSQFNHSHTVGDVRRFIQNSHPASCAKPFLLMTTFPRKELTDDSQTLGDAQLLNTVIVQRIV